MQVKFTSEKWWVLLNGSWVEIAEKDWEKIKRLVYTKEWENNLVELYPDWKQNEHQIYSLPEEVEFDIKDETKWSPTNQKWIATGKQVAHLKESEPKKEQATIFLNSNGNLRPFKIVPFTEEEERSIWNKNWIDLNGNSVGHDPKEGDTRLIRL